MKLATLVFLSASALAAPAPAATIETSNYSFCGTFTDPRCLPNITVCICEDFTYPEKSAFYRLNRGCDEVQGGDKIADTEFGIPGYAKGVQGC